MTPAEQEAWADAELEARKLDLQDRTPEGLQRAKDNAKRRRRAVGLKMGRAAALVSAAGVRRRRREAAQS